MGHISHSQEARELQTLLSCIPDQVIRPAYNHDDVYTYIEDTLEIVEAVPCSSYRCREIKAGMEPMPFGYRWATGMQADALGLWHAADGNGRLICRERAIANRRAFDLASKGVA